MKLIEAKSEDLDGFYNRSALTILGADDPVVFVKAMFANVPELFTDKELPKEIHSVKGKLLNEKYELKGDTKYPDDLTVIFIDLTHINVGVASTHPLRFVHGLYRWFDDIVDNNRRNNRTGTCTDIYPDII